MSAYLKFRIGPTGCNNRILCKWNYEIETKETRLPDMAW